MENVPSDPSTPSPSLSSPASPIIVAENLTKVYSQGRLQVAAVRGVSLTVQRGEFVAIVGPSGSGKSTLFYLLGGLTQATSGRVIIDGVDFATLDDAARTRLRKTASPSSSRSSTCCPRSPPWATSRSPTPSAAARNHST